MDSKVLHSYNIIYADINQFNKPVQFIYSGMSQMCHETPLVIIEK